MLFPQTYFGNTGFEGYMDLRVVEGMEPGRRDRDKTGLFEQ